MSKTQKNKKVDSFTVIWRNGGTNRFRWQKVLKTFPTFSEAEKSSEEISRMGYRVQIRTTESLKHGLPETWEAGESCNDFTLAKGGWMIRNK